MENEVSGIAKLGIVLIALAVLIGLGFGIFQISKGTANTGVNNVQSELDNVAVSTFSNYDQTVIGGSMARAATTDFEGKETAVLIATQAWVNAMHDTLKGTAASTAATQTASAITGSVATNLKNSGNKVYVGTATDGVLAANTSVEFKGSGFSEYRTSIIPVVNAYEDKGYTKWYEVSTTANAKSNDSTTPFPANFINYNAILGDTYGVQGVNKENVYLARSSAEDDAALDEKCMANIYFDKNCFRCETGFLTSANGRVQYNNIVGNLQKTGTTEYIPNGAKFECFLIKDTSGTTVGIAMRQINNV